MRVLIVGGGIAGLSCAYELAKAGKDFLLLEASPRLGGKILSERSGQVVYEGGPDSFITTKPDALELALELGLEDRLVSTNPFRKNVNVYTRGRMRPLPGGVMLMAPSALGPFLASDVLPWSAKLRMLLEPLIPAGDTEADWTIGAFTRRRFGEEALQAVTGPVMAGIYAGDPDRLSLESTFPQFPQMLRKHGSVLRGALAGRKAAAPKKTPGGTTLTMFMTLGGGVGELVEALAGRIPEEKVRRGARIERLERRGSRWRACLESGGFEEADAVALAVGADAAAKALKDAAPRLAAELAAVEFVSTATVSLLYPAAGFPLPLDGFGFVVDRRERSSVLAATYTGTKFPGRVPPDKVLIRCFVGGAGREEIVSKDDAHIVQTIRDDLQRMLGLDREPAETRVYRWPKANPQYNVGHRDRLLRMEEALSALPGLLLLGSSYRGVGIPDCARSGRAAARLLAGTKDTPPGAIP